MSIEILNVDNNKLNILFSYGDSSKNITYANFFRRICMEECKGLALIGYSINGRAIGILSKYELFTENVVDVIYKITSDYTPFKNVVKKLSDDLFTYTLKSTEDGILCSPDGTIITNCLGDVQIELFFRRYKGMCSEAINKILLPQEAVALDSYHISYDKISYKELNPENEDSDVLLEIEGHDITEEISDIIVNAATMMVDLSECIRNHEVNTIV